MRHDHRSADGPDAPRALLDVPAAAPTAVRVEGVSQVFERGRPPGARGVDLTVAAGEFVCLVGASGCGKSTLLNLIAGLTEPTSGRIEVSAERPALMFQEPALLPWLTAAGNVELALRARGVGRAERQSEAERLLTWSTSRSTAASGCTSSPAACVSAWRWRAPLAQDSSVLLMDEPFAALDAITRDVLHQELTRVWAEQGLSVVFVTHNVREAARLGQRVVLHGVAARPGRAGVAGRHSAAAHHRVARRSASLAAEITRELHREISRHGH